MHIGTSACWECVDSKQACLCKKQACENKRQACESKRQACESKRQACECRKQALTWLPALTVNGIVVAAAKLAGDSALATSPLARSTEGAAPQPPLLALRTPPSQVTIVTIHCVPLPDYSLMHASNCQDGR